MKSPLVSIIIPVYKVEPYLKRCVDSVLCQTYTNLEIILVDDGSPDNCPQICDEYARKDCRIKVIHKENGGLSDARNAGLGICNGDFVFFLDSDDFISANAIHNLTTVAKKNNADIVIGNHKQFIDETKIPHLKENKPFYRISLFDVMSKYHFSNPQYITAWNKLIRSDIAKNNPFPKGKLLEDNFTTYKYYNDAKLIYISQNPIYFYRQRPSSIMSFVKKNPSVFTFTQVEFLKERVDYFLNQEKAQIAKIFIPLYIRSYLYATYVNSSLNKNTDVSFQEISPYISQIKGHYLIKLYCKKFSLYYKLQKILTSFTTLFAKKKSS